MHVQIDFNSLQCFPTTCEVPGVLSKLTKQSDALNRFITVCVSNLINEVNLNVLLEAGLTAGAAARATELRKHEANDGKCRGAWVGLCPHGH